MPWVPETLLGLALLPSTPAPPGILIRGYIGQPGNTHCPIECEMPWEGKDM